VTGETEPVPLDSKIKDLVLLALYGKLDTAFKLIIRAANAE
jgi:hypothetical protein